jgi:hypothetical protein
MIYDLLKGGPADQVFEPAVLSRVEPCNTLHVTLILAVFVSPLPPPKKIHAASLQYYNVSS